ncbi:hypothetical protein [Amycolatopsis sp. NPDC059021]|uniref:hypothetical protein n=1 Tax=Amycolatopsis sp. NPDC059021 TaxID=3346704 RepID=UPI003670AC8F
MRGLIDLRDAGWAFFPTLVDGQVVQVRGVRPWPQGWADAIAVRYTTDAYALRCDSVGGVVWRREGTLRDVVDGLLELPSPLERGAPRLVKVTMSGLSAPFTYMSHFR